jgi:hypothetical protein
LNPPSENRVLNIALAAFLLGLAGCGSGIQPMNSTLSSRAQAPQTSLSVAPSTSSDFTLAVKPATVTIVPGESGSAKITTTIAKGYDHALKLSVADPPSGVDVTLDPTEIPAPGDGTSDATISVSSDVASGTYSLKVTASEGQDSATASLKLKVSGKNPDAKFQGCWYKTGGDKYQGVIASVGNPGTYSFNALLYSGTSCSVYADQFGYGQQIDFGGFDYIFWFDHFPDQNNMSARWTVGSDTSACLVYNTSTPDCN